MNNNRNIYVPLRSALSVAVITYCGHSAGALADSGKSDANLEQMVVTGVKTELPLSPVTDPKKPRQPLPANDGADYLKTIAGFSVIRKGGTDGDPVLRGMAGSRLNMVLDGDTILGGCSNRMDPPTAYIFPETLDTIKVIKGPQTVKYGPGNSAGVVLFERDRERPTEAGWHLYTSLLAGTAGREDGTVDASYASPEFSLRGTATQASADNYEDGDGVEVHSQYQRWKGQLTAAWTPDADTRFELNASRSDGEAAYADRGVDGAKFARESYGAKFSRENISELVQSIEFHAYYNYVDHVMDNFSLREPSGMMATQMAMNPDRKTTGGKLALELAPTEAVQWSLGLDVRDDRHSNRSTMHQQLMDYRDMKREADAEFQQVGLYSEISWEVLPGRRWITGVRVDEWEVRDLRDTVKLSMMQSVANPTAGDSRKEQLHSGFLRYEFALDSAPAASATVYAGLGYSERFPDYWEIFAKETEDSISALGIAPEKTTQLDMGYLYSGERLSASVSTFANTVDDYLMIQTGYMKSAVSTDTGMSGMDGASAMRSTSIVRNIDARTWGLEMELNYRLQDNLRTELTVSSVRGANESDGTTLAQLPPWEARLGLYYELPRWSAGVLWRSIASQERVDIGKGNIAGQDFGPTDAANILSVNAGWRLTNELLLTAGIDNLLDETYAEHISRAGATIPGFDQLTRINEPGRTLWLKGVYSF
ncbi:iron complex outermembrane recepter protein [Microbulbifer thermotolerans]|uniref:TonB-dependent copper receptor n=1 Tax=Microbulbifer thermotolerans TaxID=252514 RepID=A0AB35HX55_MICTH|nr:TonB-dependent copper receptor [Microbulbifer thermotolerans]MCX2801961.1 TonB-dependent copper receptor [Microbulbifer thermotolerans]SFC08700.1 iron complex outermembrane recepter protein [Microbulbifer thermotolerans]